MEQHATDVCTVISLVPFDINEFKPGVHPRRYDIPASIGGKPQVLVIETGISFVSVADGRPALQMTAGSADIARAVVDDYIGSQIGVDEGAAPGLAWVNGRWTAEEVVAKFPDILLELEGRNNQWFLRLVRTADDDWARYHSHRVISDMQRTACKLLSFDREWNVEVKEQPKGIRCPGCGSIAIAGTAVCGICKCVLDKVAHAKLTFA